MAKTSEMLMSILQMMEDNDKADTSPEGEMPKGLGEVGLSVEVMDEASTEIAKAMMGNIEEGVMTGRMDLQGATASSLMAAFIIGLEAGVRLEKADDGS